MSFAITSLWLKIRARRFFQTAIKLDNAAANLHNDHHAASNVTDDTICFSTDGESGDQSVSRHAVTPSHILALTSSCDEASHYHLMNPSRNCDFTSSLYLASRYCDVTSLLEKVLWHALWCHIVTGCYHHVTMTQRYRLIKSSRQCDVTILCAKSTSLWCNIVTWS